MGFLLFVIYFIQIFGRKMERLSGSSIFIVHNLLTSIQHRLFLLDTMYRRSKTKHYPVVELIKLIFGNILARTQRPFNVRTYPNVMTVETT